MDLLMCDSDPVWDPVHHLDRGLNCRTGISEGDDVNMAIGLRSLPSKPGWEVAADLIKDS